MNGNPFDSTKSTDYSDEQINQFWVEIPGGINSIIKPDAAMPMIILGGKGSGKTHIMRYFSYNLQKIRYGNEILQKLQEDKYLGIYLRCGGLNSKKFEGSHMDQNSWDTIFSYYFELWISELLLGTFTEIIDSCKLNLEISSICHRITKLFDKDPEGEFNDIDDVINFIRNQIRSIQHAVNNSSVSGEPVTGVEILASPGNLIFEIPRVIGESIEEFKGLRFLFLIDEFENLTIHQQKYVNTLVRERRDPCSIKIGSRLYGIKTYLTYSGGEEIKQGSEYELFKIDDYFRQRSDRYLEFLRDICVKRLIEFGYATSSNKDDQFYFDTFFETLTLNELENEVANKFADRDAPYIDKLLANLKTVKIPEGISKKVIEHLRFKNSYFIERSNIFIFYKEWKKHKSDVADQPSLLTKISATIQRHALIYEGDTSKKTLHMDIIPHFKNDIIDQLCRDSRIDIPYYGFENYAKMSAGIPRLLLILLKHIFRWAIYFDDQPFTNGKISREAQSRGRADANKWFLEDARMPGSEGPLLTSSMKKLGDYLREMRFADAPPECSICAFTVNTSEIDVEVQKILNHLEQYSYLVNAGERRDKNNNLKHTTFQINGIIAPEWELSIHRRGVPSIANKEAKIIFSLNSNSDFQNLIKRKKSLYNVPFQPIKASNQLEVFE